MEMLPVQEISQAIQLAVAPVFLLTGIAGILSILSHRLSRVVDRTRQVNRYINDEKSEDQQKMLLLEIKLLSKRTKIINWAIRLSVCSALAISIVIMCLFVGDFQLFKFSTVIAYLFFIAMLLVIFSLLLLLLEVNISTKNLSNNIEHLLVETISS